MNVKAAGGMTDSVKARKGGGKAAMNVLVIAPHADDETIGCGGTMAKLAAEGSRVFVCIVTKPTADLYSASVIEEKRKEVEEMKRILGVEEVFSLGFPTQKLDTIGDAGLHRALYDCISKAKPEIVLIPHKGDASKDHRLVFEAALFATRPKPGSAVKKVLSYECISSTEWGEKTKESAFLPNYYENIAGFLEKKLAAMKAYRTEIQEFPHPRSIRGLRATAEKRGTEAGFEAAEAFMLVREARK